MRPPGSEYAVNPALENRRRSKPPQWKLQNQHVAPKQLVHLGLNVRGKTVVRGGMGLFGLLPKPLGVLDGQEIAPVGHWIETHGVEVGDDDVMTGRVKRTGGLARHRAVEAHRLMVGVNDKYPQFSSGPAAIARTALAAFVEGGGRKCSRQDGGPERE